ncbi:hypothetical protein HPP92_023697 [Vanilla planifolia]|uniref:Pentatricopeptide repeat-containing protein n=1 Tax=Vanilla planifolia TaxID=51239 RepID=A0A835PQI9_VANPL|nr:hypothetical protein HPP92_024039 [Vanilla planifolia]KAG0455909.1 hypothetical protein HPP92_023697 [Vanilla planifolia]
MLEEGVSPDGVSLASFLSMLAQYGNIKQGKEVHCYLIRNRFVQNSILISSLVNFYAKLRRIDYAERTLVQSTKVNVVAWSAMIGGLVRINDLHGALLLYKHMVCSGKKPTEKSLSIILKAIRGLRFLRFGSQIHGYVIKVRFQLDKFIQSGLIGMYAACGAPSHLCRRLFDQMVVKDLVAWTTMIVAHGLQGEGSATLRLFDEMQERGVCPDSATFASALSACSSSGLLYEGLKLFCSMIHKHGIRPTKEHYASLSCLIAKDRRIGEAYKEYERLGLNEDVGALESLLRACKVHGEIAYGEMARRRLLEIEPGNYSACRILADMYFAAGRWEDAQSLLRDSGNARVS